MPVPVSKINDLFSQKRTRLLGFLDSLVRRSEAEKVDSTAHLILDNLSRAGIRNHFRHDSGFGVELGHSFSDQAAVALLIDKLARGNDPGRAVDSNAHLTYCPPVSFEDVALEHHVELHPQHRALCCRIR